MSTGRARWIAALCLSCVASTVEARTTPFDLTLAYRHAALSSPSATRPLVVSPNGRQAVYAVMQPRDEDQTSANFFNAEGSPVLSAEGSRLFLVDLATKATRPVCAGPGNDWDASWSPDGKTLAFYSDRDRSPKLWAFDVVTWTCRKLSDAPVKSLPFAYEQARWSPDGKSLYAPVWPATGPGAMAAALKPIGPEVGPSFDANGVALFTSKPALPAPEDKGTPSAQDYVQACVKETYGAASIAAIDVANGRFRLLVDEAATSVSATQRHDPTPWTRISQSGRWISYFAVACQTQSDRNVDKTRLYAVSTSGGAPILVADGLRAAIGGDEMDLDYRWNPSRDEIVFLRDGGLWRVDFTDAGPSVPVRIGADLGQLAPAIHLYSEDGNSILVGDHAVQTGNANDPTAYDMFLSLVSARDGQVRRLPFDQARWSIEHVVTRDDRSFWQPGATSLAVYVRDKQSGENVMLKLDWRTNTATELWRGRARMTAIQPTQTGLAAIYQDATTPPDVFLFPGDMHARQRISTVEPALLQATDGSIETFDTIVPQFDGSLKTVHSAVALPPGAKRGDKLPAVVWIYPGEDLTTHIDQFGAPAIGDPVQIFTSRGYAVLITNVAIGPGEQKGNAIDEIVDALMPQVYHAADLGYVDISRLALRGQSFGGYATMAVVSKTNLFRAAIPSSGIYDLAGLFGQVQYIRGQLTDEGVWLETSQPRLGAPLWTDPARYIDNSPYYRADHIHTPTLILQGTEDFVGSREAGKMYAALRRLDRPVELALYKGGNHTPAFWAVPQAVDQSERVLRFLHDHIGPGWGSE